MRSALPLLLALAACSRERPAPRPAPPPPDARPAAVVAQAPPAAPVVSEEQTAAGAEVESDYQDKLLEYDRKHLPFFREALAAVSAALARYDAVDGSVGMAGETKARRALEAAAREHGKKLAVLEKRNDALEGSRSSAVTELHVLLYEARIGYPDAVRRRLEGQSWVLDEKRAAVADRKTDLESWLARAGGAPAPNGATAPPAR